MTQRCILKKCKIIQDEIISYFIHIKKKKKKAMEMERELEMEKKGSTGVLNAKKSW